jgi:ParB family chromosome partitioning protein
VANLSQEEIARRVGKNRSTVANTLRLLRLPEEMLAALNNEGITSGHARAILSCVNPSDQKVLFGRIIKQNLSVRQAEIAAAELNRGKRMSPAGGATGKSRRTDPAVQDLEQKLIDCLGTRVKIQGTLDRGKIEISYFSRKDLERLMELLD